MFHNRGRFPLFLQFLLCLLAALLLECAVSFYAVSRGAGNPEEPLSLTSVEIADFTVDSGRYTVSGPEPRFVFALDRDPGQVVLRFAEPIPDTANIELLYSTGGFLFDRFRVTTRYLAPGTTEAVLTFPPGHWRDARISFHDSFTLENVSVRYAVPADSISLPAVKEQANPLRFLLFLLCFLAAFLPSLRKTPADAPGTSSKAPFGHGTPGSAAPVPRMRMVWPDVLRVLAAFFVILLHVAQPPSLVLPVGSKMYMAAAVCCIFGAASTPLFLLISGALLLPVRGESAGTFLKKRLTSVVLPLLLYSLFYTVGTCASVLSPMAQLRHSLSALLTRDIPTAPHFWLVYVIIGLYVLTVPLRVLLRALSEKKEKLLALAILVFLAIRTACWYRNVPPVFPPVLSGFPGIFLMGYLLQRPWMRRWDRVWMAAGPISLVLALFVASTRIDYLNVVGNRSFLSVLLTGGMFILMLRAEPLLGKLPGLCRRLLSGLGKQSYSILLVHYFVLIDLVMRAVMPLGISPLVQIGGTLILCAALSLPVALLCDRTALRALMRPFG